jgi:hypothetical protein
VLLARADCLRHQLPTPAAASIEAAGKLRAWFARARDTMAQYFADAVDRSLRLPGYWAHVEGFVLGDLAAMRAVWEETVKGPLGRCVRLLHNNGFRRILEPQVKATSNLNAMLDQERPASSPGTRVGCSCRQAVQYVGVTVKRTCCVSHSACSICGGDSMQLLFWQDGRAIHAVQEQGLWEGSCAGISTLL